MKKLFFIFIVLLIIFVPAFFLIHSFSYAQTANNYLYLNGNVGIGTTSPQALLQLHINGVGNDLLISPGGGPANYYYIGGAGGAFGGGHSMVFNVASTHGFEFAENNADKVVINPSGNVGIGTTSIPGKLTVLSPGGSSGTTPILALRQDNNSAYGVDLWVDDRVNGALTFTTNNNGTLHDLLSLDRANNKVGILTTTPISDLHIKQSTNSQYGGGGGITLERSDTTNQGAILLGSDNRIYILSGNGWMALDTGGNLQITGSLSQGSSKSIKENYNPINTQDIMNKIDQLPITQWNYKSDNPQVKHIGPFAEDFHNLFGLNGTSTTTINLVDEAGVALAGEQNLSSHVKNLEQKNKNLEERVSKLESELESIRGKN